MMKRLILFTLSCFLFGLMRAQVPQGFNYQAVAKDNEGNPIKNTFIKVKLSILSDTAGFYLSGTGTYIWEEEHTNVKTNPSGVFTLVVGDPSASIVQGSSISFSSIDWTITPLFLGVKVANPTVYKNMGSSRLWSVPYAMVADSLGGPLSKLNVNATSGSTPDEALFEVKNKTGQTVFAVYNEGVRIFVNDIDAKGAKGGFAIGGFGMGKTIPHEYLFISGDSVRVYIDNGDEDKGPKGGFAIGGFGTVKGLNQKYLTVSNDSVRIYIDNTDADKGVKGGFAIGGYGTTKGKAQDLLVVNNDSVRIYIDNKTTDKGVKGGFAIGGYDQTKNTTSQNLFTVSNDSVRIYLDENPETGKGPKGGFAIGGFNLSKGYNVKYLNVTPDSTRILTTDSESGFGVSSLNSGSSMGYIRINPLNYFIGHEAGRNITTGLYNSFIGYQAGFSNASGDNNVFIGKNVGYSNTSGYNNTFMGVDVGFSNTTGYMNTYLGTNSGYLNTSGAANVGIGSNSLYSNTEGNGNVAIGVNVLENNTTGSVNVALGDITMSKNTTGSYNVASGSGALHSNTSGEGNVANGINALFSNTIGKFNVAVGRYALNSSKTGESNIAIGERALYMDTIGSFNVAIGRQAGFNSMGNQNVFIGEMAGFNETGSNKLYIATSLSPDDNPLIGGDFSARQVGINRMPTTYTLEVGGTIWANGETISAGSTTWSDAMYKTNVIPIENALNDVLKLQGVKFDWKRSDFPDLNFPEGNQIGVIAQEVEKIFPQLVYTGPDGYKSVSYEKIIPILIEAIKEQQEQRESDKAEINVLKSQIQTLLEKTDKIEVEILNRVSN